MTAARRMFKRDYRGRFSGGQTYQVPRATLGRPTRTAKLKAAATAHHNQQLSIRVVNKGTAVTPLDAGLKKARRIMGTQSRRGDYRHVLPEDVRHRWVTLNWQHVPSRRWHPMGTTGTGSR